MNKCFFIGRLSKDPEFKEVGSDHIALCRFSIAVKRRGVADKADFIDVTTWRGLAETCNKHLMKGDQVAVVGAMQSEDYEYKGEKRRSWAVQADEVEFLRAKGETAGNGQNSAEDRRKVAASELRPVEDDELPF